VPKGNPDHIESSSASKYGKYDLEGIDSLTAASHQTAHGGYDPVYANDNPNRVLPVDVMRDLEREGVIGKLHRYYYATVGNGTSVANAKKYAAAIAKELVEAEVQGVILTST
jgi:glycine reductase